MDQPVQSTEEESFPADSILDIGFYSASCKEQMFGVVGVIMDAAAGSPGIIPTTFVMPLGAETATSLSRLWINVSLSGNSSVTPAYTHIRMHSWEHVGVQNTLTI